MITPKNPTTHSPWTLHRLSPWIVLAATLLLIAFLEHRRQPPAPVPADAPLAVFSAGRAFDALETFLDADASGRAETHPTGSAAAHEVRDRIVEELIVRGVAADAIEIHETVACRDSERWSYVGCTPVRNVVATLPGPTEGPALVLMSHYDSVGAGPGVSDDAVGVAAMLETVRALLADDPTGESRRHPVVVLVTDAEEVGLFGARGFVDRHPLATEGRVGAVLNLEARGTGGQSLLFQASEDDAWIVDAYRRAASRPATSSLYAEVYRRLPNDTDLTVFLDAGIAGINFAYAEGVQRYHTPRDDLEHLDRGSLQHHGDHLLAMTRELAAHPRLGNPPVGRAVYTDVASLFVIVYPASWALPLALLAFLGVVGLVVVATRGKETGAKQVSVRHVLVAMLGLLLCAVASIGLAWLFGELVKQLAGTTRPGWAHPVPLRAGLWALVFLVPASMGWASRRFHWFRWLRAGDAALTLASWLWLGLLAVIFAATVPGVSVFATVPALMAAALGGLASWRRSARTTEVARLGVALATAFFWFTIARGLEMGMGLHLTALVAAPLAICAWTFASYVWAESARRLRWTLAAVVLVAFVGAILVPPYSPENPQGVNVIHFEDHTVEGESNRGTVEATLWVDSGADAPPEELMADARLDPEPVQAPGGLRLGTAYRGDIQRDHLEPPRLEVLSSQPTEAGRRVTFRMAGPQADFLRLHLPETVELRRVEVAGYDVDMAGKQVPGAHLLLCTGPDCDDVEFTAELGGLDSISGELYAIRYGSVHGLTTAARRVADARPDWAVPVHSGDRVAVRVLVSLP